MTERSELKVGCFYWVKPVFDYDIDAPYIDQCSAEAHRWRATHWSNNEQPAVFLGYGKGDEERWGLLNTENEEWSVVWVGREIVYD